MDLGTIELLKGRMSEFIYVLENPSMPGLVKIGRTERSVSERVGELSSHTGVPTGFAVVKEWAVADSVKAEKTIHERLSHYRVSDNREFFKMEAEDATDMIESLLQTARPVTQRNFEREDELVARAIPIVVQQGIARPRMLEETLGISYEEALFVIRTLQGRGVIDEHNESRMGGASQPPGIAPKPNAVPPVISLASLEPKPMTVGTTPMISNYQLPPLDFIRFPDPTIQPTESKAELMEKSRLIQQTLARFDIEVALGDITKGPTITRYELHLAPGVRLETIAGLSDNLAVALRVEQINVLTPVPGKNTVGVEVPNLIKTKVIMPDLLESQEWRNTKAKIPLALGKDVYGHPIVSDLAEMPHLLIAGSTGSGKSVCINAIITSLLYRFSPDQLRFVMIDPKVIELQPYNTLPHLVVPVVTDPQKVILALRWVVNEMEKRYQVFARMGVRNIGSFNSRARGCTVEVNQEIAMPHEEDIIIPEKLSYVVVIIDELADLLLVAPDVEMAIARIAQMGRTAGIHLIMTIRSASRNTLSESTQIEIPTRIAFRCDSRIESRSVIGTAGAERLLGKGDLLYLPPGSPRAIRAQGAFITDQEVQSIVDFIARQAQPSYQLEIHQQLSRSASSWAEAGSIEEGEEIIQDCIEIIRSEQKASVSLLQRRLQLGYGRAARIMDELENRGIVGPSKGAELRDILIDLDGEGADGAGLQIAQPHLVVCLCQHCSGRIEFDVNELGDRQSVLVPCPHCGIEMSVSNPS